MSDCRFYRLHVPISARVAARAGGADLVHGDGEHCLDDVAAFDCAGPNDITFVRTLKSLDEQTTSNAGLCFCSADLLEPLKALGVGAVAVSETAELAFLNAASKLVTPKTLSDVKNAIAPDAVLAKGVQIAHGVWVGAGAQIGKNTHIGPGAIIGAGCVLGQNCIIGAGAVISFTLMEDGVDVRPGAVLGEAGLGVVASAQGNRARAHFGRVVIGDGVRIGANSTIDRAVFGDTVIGARTQIDNLVHIAHNVRMGEDCVLASFCGVAGSSVLGDRVMMGGRAGITDHITIGNDVSIAAAAAVMKDIADGEIWGGHPARPLRTYQREQIALKNLADKKGNQHGNDE